MNNDCHSALLGIFFKNKRAPTQCRPSSLQQETGWMWLLLALPPQKRGREDVSISAAWMEFSSCQWCCFLVPLDLDFGTNLLWELEPFPLVSHWCPRARNLRDGADGRLCSSSRKVLKIDTELPLNERDTRCRGFSCRSRCGFGQLESWVP